MAPPEEAELAWRGWLKLQSERSIQIGMGGAVWLPIPYSKRMFWLDRHGIDGAYAELIDGVWEGMDAIWLDWHQRKAAETQGGDRAGH